jgi:hypothetical protein
MEGFTIQRVWILRLQSWLSANTCRDAILRGQISVLSGPIWAQVSDPPSSQHMQPKSRHWRPNTKPATGSVLCAWVSGNGTPSSPGKVGPARAPHAAWTTLLVKSDPLPLHNHLLWPSPTQTVGRMSQDLLSNEYALFSGPRVSQLKMVPAVTLQDKRDNSIFFFPSASLPYESSHCLTKSLHWV